MHLTIDCAVMIGTLAGWFCGLSGWNTALGWIALAVGALLIARLFVRETNHG